MICTPGVYLLVLVDAHRSDISDKLSREVVGRLFPEVKVLVPVLKYIF